MDSLGVTICQSNSCASNQILGQAWKPWSEQQLEQPASKATAGCWTSPEIYGSSWDLEDTTWWHSIFPQQPECDRCWEWCGRGSRKAWNHFWCSCQWCQKVGYWQRHRQKNWKVNVFINGDAMPGPRVVPWLKTMHAEYPDLKVYKAVGTHTDVDLAKRKLEESRIPETQITVVQAKTASANAADAVLTVLFGRHAQACGLNYVLSDDKQWFGELPRMEISPGIRTVWMRFSELESPRFLMSREEEQLCQMLLEYCRSKGLLGGERQIREVYRGKRFRKYVFNKNEYGKLFSVGEDGWQSHCPSASWFKWQVQSTSTTVSNIASGLAWKCT